jgi:hypothetical protein
MSDKTNATSARWNTFSHTAQCWLSTIALLAVSLGSASAQAGGNFEVTRSTLSNGGEQSAGGGFIIFSTIGQPLASGADNASSGGQFSITGGFWTFAVPANPTPTPAIVVAGAVLVNESCPPANGEIDPGERVTVHISLMNNGAASISNLVAQLQAGTGVAAPSNPQGYEAIAPNAVSGRDFSFTADSSLIAGQTITAVLRLQDGVTDLGMVSITFPAGPSPCTGVRLVVTTTPLQRSGDLVTTTISVQNIGNLPADNVSLTTAMLGSTSGVIEMPNLNTINIGSSVSAQVSFTTAATGASKLTIGGTYGPGIAGTGSFSTTKRTTIP